MWSLSSHDNTLPQARWEGRPARSVAPDLEYVLERMPTEEEYRDRLKAIVLADDRLAHILRVVREVNPPEWLLGAGAIRSTVWDCLHGHTISTPLEDLDVAYFDDQDLSEQAERAIESELQRRFQEILWDVHNQAGDF